LQHKMGDMVIICVFIVIFIINLNQFNDPWTIDVDLHSQTLCPWHPPTWAPTVFNWGLSKELFFFHSYIDQISDTPPLLPLLLTPQLYSPCSQLYHANSSSCTSLPYCLFSEVCMLATIVDDPLITVSTCSSVNLT